jgi:hypothetical protein
MLEWLQLQRSASVESSMSCGFQFSSQDIVFCICEVIYHSGANTIRDTWMSYYDVAWYRCSVLADLLTMYRLKPVFLFVQGGRSAQHGT